MNKKIFIGLFVISLIVFAGGCGGSSHSVTGSTDVNTALSGAWTLSANGTASVTSTVSDDLSDIEALIGPFEELSSEVLENIGVLIGETSDIVKEKYDEEKKKGIAETVNVSVTSAMAFFEDCDISNDKGSAKLTAIVILSGDSLCLPVFYNGAAISTQRNGTNNWTATTSDGDTLSITMASDEKMTFSGKVNYLGYVCDFSTVMDKNAPNSINPQEILDGTWNLDGDLGGGYLAVNSETVSTIIPEAVSICFKDTKEESSAITSNVTSFYSLYMKTSNTGSNDGVPVLRIVNPASAEKLTKIYDNVYEFTEENGDGIIFIENTNEIFVFMAENEDNAGQACMFLPLKKADFDIESAIEENEKWTVSDGGGYAETDSFTLGSASLTFSGVTADTATVNINASLAETNDTSAYAKSRTYNKSLTMKRSDNFLSFEDSDKTAYNLAFISETEAFLSINNENSNEYFVLRFSTANH